MDPTTPRGFRDRLPAEAGERRAIVRAVDAAFASWGYGLVETPSVEVLETLEEAGGPLGDRVFRLFDSDGRLLAMRPEMTVPVARVVASRLSSEPGPHRLRYVADVFREHESLRGQPREFTQLGVELVGAAGAEADAEVLAVLMDGIDASGLPEYTVALGTVALLHALIDAAQMDDAWGEAVLAAAHDRNVVALDRLASADGVTAEAGRAISHVMRIRGGREAIEECRVAAGACGCDGVLDEFERTWDLLDAVESAGRLVVDFGVLRQFDYYTGIVFEAYAPGLGMPIGGGGRYDGVLAAYGDAAPAAGFALGLERVQVALVEQRVRVAVRGVDAVVGGEGVERFVAAGTLRAAGWNVALADGDAARIAERAAAIGAHMALEASAGEVSVLDRTGAVTGVLEAPYPAAPGTTGERRGF